MKRAGTRLAVITVAVCVLLSIGLANKSFAEISNLAAPGKTDTVKVSTASSDRKRMGLDFMAVLRVDEYKAAEAVCSAGMITGIVEPGEITVIGAAPDGVTSVPFWRHRHHRHHPGHHPGGHPHGGHLAAGHHAGHHGHHWHALPRGAKAHLRLMGSK